MTRTQLEHLVRASASVTGERDLVVIGVGVGTWSRKEKGRSARSGAADRKLAPGATGATTDSAEIAWRAIPSRTRSHRCKPCRAPPARTPEDARGRCRHAPIYIESSEYQLRRSGSRYTPGTPTGAVVTDALRPLTAPAREDVQGRGKAREQIPSRHRAKQYGRAAQTGDRTLRSHP